MRKTKETIRSLQDQRIWMLFKLSEDRATGKLRKKPISAQGKPIGPKREYIGKLATYEEACEAQERLKADRVGFILPPGYFLVDIDDRPLDDPLTKDIMARFPTYAEKSASGKGLHIYGRCDESRIRQELDLSNYYTNSHALRVECYLGDINNQLAVFTGDSIKTGTLNDCS